MSNTIKIMSYQSKIVYENLKNNNIHYARKENHFSKITPLTFNHGLSLVNKHISGKPVIAPVFAWYRLEDIQLDHITDIKELEDFVVYANDKTGISENDIIMILEVPINELILTDFYEYTDCLYVEEFEYDEEYDNLNFKHIYMDKDDHRVSNVQIMMKYIKPEWVIKVFNKHDFNI